MLSKYSLTSFLIAAVLPFGMGAAADTSEALVKARSHFANPELNALSFQAADLFFPVETIGPGSARKLPQRLAPLDPVVAMKDQTIPFEQALDRTYTNALLVMHDGVLVHERYLNGSDPETRFMSWSIAKSITSILIGIALERGMIKSLDEPIDAYLPELKETAYAGVSIEDMLLMRDGTSYDEQNATSPSGLSTTFERSFVRNEGSYTGLSVPKLVRKHAPGTVFNYSTLTSTLLGRIVEAASGMTLAAFTERYLWKPAGMEAPAYWVLDAPLPEGKAFAGGGFGATLRDYARLGQMMLDSGRANGRQIVSRDWVEKSTRYAGDTPVISGAPRGYQYQWWTMLGTDRFEAIGIHGQFLSIDPQSRTVIVKMSHWPQRGGLQYNLDTLALLNAIRVDVAKEKTAENK